MRRMLPVVLVVLALALPTLDAVAQARRQGRQTAGNVPIAQMPLALLDSVCKLEPAQKQKIEEIQSKLTADLRALRLERGAQPDPGAAQMRRDLVQAAVSEINNVLTPEQREAIRKAMPALATLRSAAIPLEVIPQLKLTEDQKKQMVQIAADAREKLRNLPAEERRTKMRESMTEVRQKIEALLTDEQKAIIQKHRDEARKGTRRNRP